MRVPSLVRRTPFRLTLLFLALFATAASALLAYIYVATVDEANHRAEADVQREVRDLETIYRERGPVALNAAVAQRTWSGGRYLYLLTDLKGGRTGNLSVNPVETPTQDNWHDFKIAETDESKHVTRKSARGLDEKLAGGERLFVGMDLGDTDEHLDHISRVLWLAWAMVLLLGLGGGYLVSRNVERSMGDLNRVVAAVQAGDLRARATTRHSGDELDELAQGLNVMLEKLEQSMAAIRHAGDAIAHDLRSPLNRMRAKLEVAMLDAERGEIDPKAALAVALGEADELLKTFNTVLAISRLQAAGEPPDPQLFDAGELAADLAELYAPASEENGLAFSAEVQTGLNVHGNRGFVAQALANLIDNAVKYTPKGGAVMLRARRRSSGEIELSVTDTGPGVPEADRERVTHRFVRLENSRSAPGSGLGLSLVQAVAEVHGGRLDLDEGPGKVGDKGPGLRAALVFSPA
jgi:signal transduction histidine kinase